MSSSMSKCWAGSSKLHAAVGDHWCPRNLSITISRMILFPFIARLHSFFYALTELQRTGHLVLFWLRAVVDLKIFVNAINSFCFRSFACVKNTIKHTAPRRSRTLARSVRRVLARQSRDSTHPKLSWGLVEKKNSASY